MTYEEFRSDIFKNIKNLPMIGERVKKYLITLTLNTI